MNLEELNTRFKDVSVSDTSINEYVFDDLSSINSNRQKSFPVILMKPPNSVITPFQSDYNEALWENYTISFYIFDTWTQTKQKVKALDQAYKELDIIADKYLKNVLLQGANEYSLIGDKGVTKTRGHHQHVDALIGINYTFTLRVHNSLCYDLGQPTNLVAAQAGSTQIDLTWVDNATSETGYNVYRSADGYSWTLLSQEAADSTSYSDTGLSSDTIYYYKVVPYNANGEGVASNVVAQCTSGVCAAGTQVIKDSAGTILYTNAIPSGASEDQTITDASLTINFAATISDIKAQGTSNVLVKDGTDTQVGSWNGSAWIVPTGGTPSGIAYERPTPTGSETSYRTGDDAWRFVLGNDRYTANPVYPASYAVLDFDHATDPFLYLVNNNKWGNKNRFTSELGDQDYTNNMVQDHLTGLMWTKETQATATWNNQIDAAEAFARGGFSNWHMPTWKELASIQLSDTGNRGMTYAPFSFATGTLYQGTSTTGYISTELLGLQYNLEPYFNGLNKAFNYGTFYCRDFV